MTFENLRRWWHWHEGWIAAISLAVCMFMTGWFASAIHEQTVQAKQAIMHAQEIQRLSEAYREALGAKDLLIANMANSNANATQAAAQATDAAAQAVDTAHDTTKTLGKLK